ncbi:MAG: hypothetical protein U0939_16990 [Pirellulales bacterium]
MKGVRVDVTGCFLDRTGLCARDLANLAPRLEAARAAMLARETAPDWARQLAADYDANRWESALYRVLKGAHHLRDQVDAAVIVGPGDWTIGAKALMQACSDPYFNEHDRGERGSRQRLYFAGEDHDNDALQGLVRRLEHGPIAPCDGRWALVAIAGPDSTPETEIAFDELTAALRRKLKAGASTWQQFIVPMTAGNSLFAERLRTLQGEHGFRLPDEMPPCASLFSAVALLPAAMLGADVVRFLRGAMQMRERFLREPIGQNPVLDLVGVQTLLERRCGLSSRVLSVWASALAGAAEWRRRLARTTASQGGGRWRIAGVADAAERRTIAAQLASDELLIQWCVEQWRCDPAPAGVLDGAPAGAEATLPQRTHYDLLQVRRTLREAGRAQIEVWLPQVDEGSLGQLFQLALLANELEGWLRKNPPPIRTAA